MIDRDTTIYNDTRCKMCGAEYEDLIHFMIKCKALEEEKYSVNNEKEGK